MTAAAATLCLVLVVALGMALSFAAGVLWTLHLIGRTTLKLLTYPVPASQSKDGSFSRPVTTDTPRPAATGRGALPTRES